MEASEQDNGKEVFMIRYWRKFRGLLAFEVAMSRGLKARLEEGKGCWELYIYAIREDAKSAVKTGQDGEELLHLLQLEALAQTVKSLGEKPSKGLLEAIVLERRQLGFHNDDRLRRGFNGGSLSNQN